MLVILQSESFEQNRQTGSTNGPLRSGEPRLTHSIDLSRLLA
jgi:hypothetical protein